MSSASPSSPAPRKPPNDILSEGFGGWNPEPDSDQDMDFVIDFFALCWEHRRNPPIAAGGIAIACLGISFGLDYIPGVPAWFKSVSFVGFSLFALLFVILLCYSIIKALIAATKKLFAKPL